MARSRDVDNWTARLSTNTPLNIDQASDTLNQIRARVREAWGYSPREIVDRVVEQIVACELADFEPVATFPSRVSVAIKSASVI